MDKITQELKPSAKTRLIEWLTVFEKESTSSFPDLKNADWEPVRVPHNWEHYHGYHAVSHGNLHGTAWYRTHFSHDSNERMYAFFEGVGSFASVYVNGILAGTHAGGRTTFTIDLTEYLEQGENLLLVKAEHPEKIDDLPFVCGGCWGAPNTEGSQPLGIFRPAWLERTGPVRVEPFGVHVLTPSLSKACVQVQTHTTLQNPSTVPQTLNLVQTITDEAGHVCGTMEQSVILAPQSEETVVVDFPQWSDPQLWSPDSPLLHQVKTSVLIGEYLSHETETNFGLRWVTWPRIDKPDADHNVVSTDRRGRLIHNGDTPRLPDNNGLTKILARDPLRRIGTAPMGVVVRQKASSNNLRSDLTVSMELESTADKVESIQVLCEIQNEGGTVFFHQYRTDLQLKTGCHRLNWEVPSINHPHFWSKHNCYLHSLIVELRTTDGELLERSETLFGLRYGEWNESSPLNLDRPKFESLPGEDLHDSEEHERRLLLNGKPLFLRGTCEYETLLGCDHAFSDEQINADVAMMRAAGFNAFRDAHHPHNLRYYDHWDRAGIVCWTQMGSHIWFDNERFRHNYKQLVREWVKERRNHPCILIWGLQNESSLPETFARELRSIIRELDPTSPQWRITTTCNGGKGSDWNVPQEWSGTYGGNCHDYDLQSAQMVGEYGAWRNFGVHTESVYCGNENDRSESWACAAMEAKLRLGEKAKGQAIGHFHWVFNSFPNPGRSAGNYEGPGNAQIGSINNKGLVTAWHQPSDLYYLFRSHYADGATDPMVYIVSHTWPNRWQSLVARKVSVFSNCEAVELFNGVRGTSYGLKRHPGFGYHYSWENILPKTNLLHAVGYCGGQVVAEDLIRLDYLKDDPTESTWVGPTPALIAEKALFRINCGSDTAYCDPTGAYWAPDVAWSADASCGWESWGNCFENVADDLASQGFTMTPVRGTGLQGLYRTYRYGRQYLKYHFRTGPGRYRLRCHFAEPWFGLGSELDASGWRLFDVAINDCIVDSRLDVWKLSGGHHRGLVREYFTETDGDILTLHFPNVVVNQAILFGVECLDA